MRIKHSKTISEPGDLDCSDYNSDHEIAEPIQLADLNEVKLLGYTLVEEKILPAGTTQFSFDNLDGDADLEYLIESDLVISVDATLSFKINGASSNLISSQHIVSHNGHVFQNVSRISLAESGWGVSGVSKASFKIFAPTGVIRQIIGTSNFVSSNAAAYCAWTYNSFYNNSISNITSISFYFSAGTNPNCFGIVRLWKKIPITEGV